MSSEEQDVEVLTIEDVFHRGLSATVSCQGSCLQRQVYDGQSSLGFES